MIKLTDILKEVKIKDPRELDLGKIPYNLEKGKKYLIKWTEGGSNTTYEEICKFIEADEDIEDDENDDRVDDEQWLNVETYNEEWKEPFDEKEGPYIIQIHFKEIISIKNVYNTYTKTDI